MVLLDNIDGSGSPTELFDSGDGVSNADVLALDLGAAALPTANSRMIVLTQLALALCAGLAIYRCRKRRARN